jgi:hypothetical protein
MQLQDIKPLTKSEINELQVDAVLRKMAELDEALYEINRVMIEANENYYRAKQVLDDAKNLKSIIVERARNLKAIANSA